MTTRPLVVVALAATLLAPPAVWAGPPFDQIREYSGLPSGVSAALEGDGQAYISGGERRGGAPPDVQRKKTTVTITKSGMRTAPL